MGEVIVDDVQSARRVFATKRRPRWTASVFPHAAPIFTSVAVPSSLTHLDCSEPPTCTTSLAVYFERRLRPPGLHPRDLCPASRKSFGLSRPTEGSLLLTRSFVFFSKCRGGALHTTYPAHLHPEALILASTSIAVASIRRLLQHRQAGKVPRVKYSALQRGNENPPREHEMNCGLAVGEPKSSTRAD